jgi:hypothetical protein
MGFGFFMIEFGYLIPLHPPCLPAGRLYEWGNIKSPPFIKGRRGGIIQAIS